jgi:hypothetical protein
MGGPSNIPYIQQLLSCTDCKKPGIAMQREVAKQSKMKQAIFNSFLMGTLRRERT